VLLTDRHDSVAADMERASDCANGMAPDEFIYYSLTNTKQAAFCVVPFRVRLRECGCETLAHDQVNI